MLIGIHGNVYYEQMVQHQLPMMMSFRSSAFWVEVLHLRRRYHCRRHLRLLLLHLLWMHGIKQKIVENLLERLIEPCTLCQSIFYIPSLSSSSSSSSSSSAAGSKSSAASASSTISGPTTVRQIINANK